METRQQGLLDSEPLREADEDLVSEVNLDYPIMTEEEREEIQRELIKLEEEISTLKQVLGSKEKQHSELKQKLGVTPLSELKNNFSRSWMDMQSTTAFKKTSETLTTAGNKTSAAFNTLGTAITRKFGDMRNSQSFRSFEEKVENTVTTIKTKVGGPGTEGSFQDVLSSAANATPQETPTNDTADPPEMPH
ncbi:tumor protein D53 isoform X2 [Genypterus blacodes]|uniref:tumor protein D53 isoform X2 n=1 Tax=Genypterus blacodes TaxID=154954 RepID=UPI003F75D66C